MIFVHEIMKMLMLNVRFVLPHLFAGSFQLLWFNIHRGWSDNDDNSGNNFRHHYQCCTHAESHSQTDFSKAYIIQTHFGGPNFEAHIQKSHPKAVDNETNHP